MGNIDQFSVFPAVVYVLSVAKHVLGHVGTSNNIGIYSKNIALTIIGNNDYFSEFKAVVSEPSVARHVLYEYCQVLLGQ